MQTVYVDVLVAVNLLVDYFLLLLVAKFLHIPVRRRRLLFGALVGAAGSLVILLPALPPVLDFLLKLSISLPVTLAAFGYRGAQAFFRQLFSFFLLSFAFAGFFLAVWYFLAPEGLFVKNSVVYLDLSPLFFVGVVLAGYWFLRLLQRITGRGPLQNTMCRVTVTLAGNSRTFSARIDTGSALKEPFSGLPVIVAEARALPPPPAAPPRVVPYHTVGGEGLLRAWRAESCTLLFPGGGQRGVACYIAYAQRRLSGGEFQALVPPVLCESGTEHPKNTEKRRKGNGHAGEIEKMALPLDCRTGSLHQRPGNLAAAVDKSRGGEHLSAN